MTTHVILITFALSVRGEDGVKNDSVCVVCATPASS